MELIKTITIFLVICVTASMGEEPVHNFLDNFELPTFYDESPSPLKSKDSLRSREYFDFLNTLYRHDTTKSDLFQAKPSQIQPVYAPLGEAAPHTRRARAIIFRPLFVYKQQQVRKEKLSNTVGKRY